MNRVLRIRPCVAVGFSVLQESDIGSLL